MKGFIRIIAIMLCAVLIFSCAGCNSNASTADKNIRINLNSMPTNLDPQLAYTDEELLIVRNCFEGLFRIDAGKVVPAACEKYSVSEDGLTYTFTLKKGLKWSDGSELEAEDFRFGLIRALRPETLCPDASLLYCIKNSAEVHSGSVSEDALGIRIDGDGRLVIELHQPDNDLLETLTHAMAMPCDRELFEKAGGRYCMTPALTMSNGPFALSKWTESTIKFARNSEYVGKFTAMPASFTLTFGGSDSERIEKINTDFTDIALISTQSVSAAEDALLETVCFYNTVWALVINPDANVVGDPAVSAALKKAIGSDTVKEVLPDHFRLTDRMIADDLLVDSKSYRNYAGESGTSRSDASSARSDLIAALKAYSGRLPTVTLKYADTDGMKHTATHIAQQWAKELGAVVNIEGLSQSDLQTAMAAGDYQIALCPISTDNGKAVSAISRFATIDNRNVFGFSNADVDRKINELSSIDEPQALADALKDIDRIICADSHVLPLAQSGKCYAVSGSVVGVEFDCNSGGMALYNAGK